MKEAFFLNTGDNVKLDSGSFTVVSHIGHGSTAEVYKISNGSREFALKVFSLKNGVHESAILSQLSHPNIPGYFSHGDLKDHDYLLMELLTGEPFSKKFPRESLIHPSQFLPTLRGVGEAVEHDHTKQIIHRDLKPNNFLVSGEKTYLTDFGISHDFKMQKEQDSLGPAHYIAPEQIDGGATYQSDQYSLAICVYTWLTGTYPLHDQNRDKLLQLHKHGLIEPLNHRRKKNGLEPVKDSIEASVMKALSRNPSERFSTVSDFIDIF